MYKHFLFAVLLLIPPASYGAGFDCGKANTRVEKLICEDTELSELDSRMSHVYEQALTRTPVASRMREEQRRWLHDTRDRCSERSCLWSAYVQRIEGLSGSISWMTNEKEQEICEEVVDAINDGSIIRLFRPFERASEDDQRSWAENMPNPFLLYLSQTLKINVHGRSITLGLVQGGGTCGNCDIVDINALEPAVYPADDSEGRFRWSGWGQCDHFLFVEGEPVIVTGNFGWGTSHATLATWLAPDGAKRALCYLEPDPGRFAISKIAANNLELCDAVARNEIEEIPWSTSLSIPRENTGNDATMWDSMRHATLDINLDGKEETIFLFDHSSGAGCGSYRQWLREFTVEQRSAFLEGSRSCETPLNRIFSENGQGPIKSTQEGDNWHTVKLFRHAGKPYIFCQGTESSAEVISVWENQKRSWCEYQILPQHKIEVFYPVETWPALKISTLKKTKGAQALHNAVTSNNKGKVLALLASGTPVDAADESGQTPLGRAVFMGQMGMVKLLLDNGASASGVRGWHGSPLISATSRNNVELVELLLERKADPNLRSEPHPSIQGHKGFTALEIARSAETQFRRNPDSEDAKKNRRIIDLLLRAGATQ